MFRFETAGQGVRFEGASHLAWNLKLKPLSAAAPASAPAIQIAQNGPRTSQGPGQQRRQHQMRQQNGHRGAAIPELSNQIAGGTNAGNALESIEVPANVQGDSASEAFLLRGTLSRGLKQMGGDPGGDMGPGFGRGPGMFGGGEFGGPGVRSDGQNGFAALGRGITEIVGNRANPAGQ